MICMVVILVILFLASIWAALFLASEGETLPAIFALVLMILLAITITSVTNRKNDKKAVENATSIYHKDILSLNMDQFYVTYKTNETVYVSKDGKYILTCKEVNTNAVKVLKVLEKE